METVVAYLSDLTNILLTILAFGFIIFVHELGHFIMAKRAGVKVDKFYLGFDFGGLKIFSFKYQETEYGIGVFPFGGYVKLHGIEELPGHEMEKKDLPEEHFQKKTVGERFGIMAGGVAMNFISAFLLIFLMYGIGKEFNAPVVGEVTGGAAYEAGLRSNDEIISINGSRINTFMDIQKQVLLIDEDEKVEIKYKRDDAQEVIQFKPDRSYISGITELGILPKQGVIIGNVINGSPADEASLKVGDKIVSVEGQEINEFYEYKKIMEDSANKELNIGYERNGQAMNCKIKLSKMPSYLRRFDTGLNNNESVEIVSVQKDGVAHQVGFQTGDFINKINGARVHTIGEIADVLDSNGNKPVQVELLRGEETIVVDLLPRYSDVLRRYLLGVHITSLGLIQPIKEVEDNGPASQAGLQKGDLIIKANGQEVKSIAQLLRAIDNKFSSVLKLTVKRNGEEVNLGVQLRSPVPGSFFSKLSDKFLTLFSGNAYIYDSFGMGIRFENKYTLAEPAENSPAQLSGFLAGDELVSVSYKNPKNKELVVLHAEKLPNGWSQIGQLFSTLAQMESKDEKKGFKDIAFDPQKHNMDVTFLRNGVEMVKSISAIENVLNNSKGFDGVEFEFQKVKIKYNSVASAFTLVITEGLSMLEFTAQSFARLVTGKLSTEALSGPVGVFSVTHQVAKTGIIELLWLVAFLSINIGFLNFLPFPPLDGGAVFFLMIEKIKGSPVSAKFQIAVANVGVLFLISLMLFVTINDIGRSI